MANKKVVVQFEMDLDLAKRLAASNKSATRRLTAADLEKLAEHGQVAASALFEKKELAGLMTTFSKMRQFPDYAPEVVASWSRRLADDGVPKLKFVKAQVLWKASGPEVEPGAMRTRRR